MHGLMKRLFVSNRQVNILLYYFIIIILLNFLEMKQTNNVVWLYPYWTVPVHINIWFTIFLIKKYTIQVGNKHKIINITERDIRNENGWYGQMKRAKLYWPFSIPNYLFFFCWSLSFCAAQLARDFLSDSR